MHSLLLDAAAVKSYTIVGMNSYKIARSSVAWIAFVVLVGCSPAGILFGPMTGVWHGSIDDSALGVGQVRLDVEQDVCTWTYACGWIDAFQGTYTIQFTGSTIAGPVYASWDGSGIELVFTRTTPYCRVVAYGVRDGSRAIEAQFETSNSGCFSTSRSTGTIAVSK